MQVSKPGLLAAAAFVLLAGYWYAAVASLLWFTMGVGINDHIPTFIDYLQYWKEVCNVRLCLPVAGYFGHEEALPALNRLGLDTPGASHGIVIDLFHALLALPAWNFDTPVYVNIGLTALGPALYIMVSRCGPRRAGLALAGMASLYPLYYFNACIAFQSVHFSLACLVAGLIVRTLDPAGGSFSRRTWLWLLAAVAFGALLRKNWALLLVPLAFLPPLPAKRRVWAVLGAVVAAGLLGVVFDATRSPYPYREFSEDLRPIVLGALGRGDLGPLWQQITINFRIFGDFVAKHDFDTVYAVFLLAATALFLVNLSAGGATRRLRLFSLLTLAASVASAAVMYYIFQVMLLKIVVQVFLILFLVAVRFVPPRVTVAFVLVNLLFLPAFLDHFRVLGSEYLYAAEKRQAIETFRQRTAPFFAAPAADRWGNTVLILDYPPELLGLPPCIQVMDTREEFLRQRGYVVRTGYVLVADPAVEARLVASNTLQLLTETSAGRLYAVR